MIHDLVSGARSVRTKSLVLGAALLASTTGLVAGANAQDTSAVHPDAIKTCGTATACIHGNNTGDGPGVEGDGANDFGVYGLGTGFNAGVGGYSTQTAFGGSGVFGQSQNGYGVYGRSISSSGYGLYSQGNAYVTGLLYTGGPCQSGCSKTRQQVSFAGRTSQPTIDDIGEAVLRNGVAHVALARDFANAIDAQRPYLVMLTPEGDASLYVANRTQAGFDVRQVGGGRSSVPFAYRIVAKPYGASDERLPFKAVPDPATYMPQRATR